MHVTIPEELESYVGEQVATGAFESADALVAASLQSFRDHPLASPEAQAQIMEGYRQAKAGQFYEGTMEDIKREARAKWDAEQAGQN